jgi:putative DNA primase/helicase
MAGNVNDEVKQSQKTCRSPLDAVISLFPNAYDVTPARELTIREFLAEIKGGTYRRQIEPLRKLVADGDMTTYKKRKELLPGASLSARVITRAEKTPLPEKLVSHSQVIQIDVDNVQNTEGLKKKLSADPNILFFYDSPSGKGLKTCVRIDGTQHRASFESAEKYFLEKYGLSIDTSVKDVVRLCFASHDPDLYVNESAQILPITNNGTKPALNNTPPKQSYSSPPEPGRKLTYGERALETARKMIEQSKDGEKYPTLLKAGKLAGGYVAGGMLSYCDAENSLKNAIESKANVHCLKTAYQAIESSLKHGQQNPIEFEDLERQRIQYLETIRTVTAPETTCNVEIDFTPEELSKAVYSEQDGDASIYIKLYRDRFRFDHSSGIWLERKEHYYSEDIIGESLAAIDKITGLYEKEAARFFWLQMKAVKEQNTKAEHEAEKELKAYRRKIGLLQKIQWKQAVLQLAAAGKHSLGLTGNEWDQDPWILPCINGIVDLKTGNLRPGRKDEYIKTVCPHEYKGLGLETPAWKVFIASLFDNTEIAAFIQRLFGSALLGVVIEHLLPILTGGGRNGKGTILEALKYALGALAGPVPSELLLRQRDSKNPDAPSASLMALRGKRIVWASETERGRQFSTQRVKWLCGGDTVTGRDPFGRRQVEFSPTHSIFLLTNDKPRANASDFAFWSRVLLIPFRFTFIDNPQGLYERKRDPHQLEKLKAEAPGILTWLVGGCLEWQKQGLNPPKSILAETEQYRQGEDQISRFIEDCCFINSTVEVKSGELFKAYRQWCEENGERATSGRTFGEEIGKKFDSYRKATGVHYTGLEIGKRPEE